MDEKVKLGLNFISDIAFFIIIALSLSDRLRISAGVLSWAPVMIFLFLNIKKIKFRVGVHETFFMLFCLSIYINIVVSSDWVHTLFRFAKVTLIYLLILCIKEGAGSVYIAIKAAMFVMFCNAAFIALGFFGYSFFAIMGGANRWETIFSYPGTLFMSGLFIFIITIYNTLYSNCKFNFRELVWKFLLLTTSLFVLFADGSRTAIVMFVWVVLCFAMLTFKDLQFKKIFFIYLVYGAVFSFIFSQISLHDGVSFGRAAHLFESGFDADDERVLLLNNAIEWIGNNNPFLFGKGFAATVHSQDIEYVVHNGYIFAYEQLGLVGFICFAVIIFYPIARLLKRYLLLNDILSVPSLMFYCVFSIFLLFHPVATEYGPWFFYLMGFLFFKKTSPRDKILTL